MAFVMVVSVLFNASLTVYATEPDPEPTYSLTVDSRSSASGTVALSIGDVNNVTSAKAGEEVTVTVNPIDSKSCDGVVITKTDKTPSIGMTKVSGLGSNDMDKLFDGNTNTSWQCDVPTNETEEIYLIFKTVDDSKQHAVDIGPLYFECCW